MSTTARSSNRRKPAGPRARTPADTSTRSGGGGAGAARGREPVEENPRATDDENITAMGRTIAALEERGHTYRSDGSIYFKISTLPDYGKLARLAPAGTKSGARTDSDRYEKEDAREFVLWKATKPGKSTCDPG